MPASICRDEGKTHENEISQDSSPLSDIQSHMVRVLMFLNFNVWGFDINRFNTIPFVIATVNQDFNTIHFVTASSKSR